MADALTSGELNTLENLINGVFEYSSNKRAFKAPRTANQSVKPLTAMFGFVPVIEDSEINLYIKIGGPENVRFGSVTGTSRVSKFPKVLDSADRDKLTHALATNPKNFGYTKRELKNEFPFRIIYSAGYQLQYAEDSDSEYGSLKSRPELKANIVSEVLTTAIEYYGLIDSSKEKSNIQLLLKASRTEIGVGKILSLFLTQMHTDLNNYLIRIISHNYNDKTGAFLGLEQLELIHDLYSQHLVDGMIEGLLAYPRTKGYNRNIEKFSDFKKQFDLGIRKIGESITDASHSGPEVLADVKSYTNLLGMSTKADLSTINTLTKANADLRKELEAVQAKVPANPNLPKYLGIGAGLVSGYFAIQQESAQDLETWKKGAIVATSGLLGAVPYLNFVTIATMPYLVNKGVELSGDEEFKASARERMAQARQGADRIATSVGEGARRLIDRQPQLAEES
tara:strand:- start:4689 stop:6047 length:1359 start_codon:yes stop_codon:yes gene_type:complete